MTAINRIRKVSRQSRIEARRIEEYNLRNREWCPICKKILINLKCPDKHVDYSSDCRQDNLSAKKSNPEGFNKNFNKNREILFGKVKLSAPRRRYDRFDKEPITIGDFAVNQLVKGKKISCGL